MLQIIEKPDCIELSVGKYKLIANKMYFFPYYDLAVRQLYTFTCYGLA